jgi:hypothetical protein
MYTLGIVLAIVGGGAFASVVFYYLADSRRTGIQFRAHKKILLPIILAGFAIFVTGAFTAGLADGQL